MRSRFPSVETADEDGLVAVGGKLTPDWLIDAYTHGIFPWPIGEDYPITWFAPDPRAILPLDQAHFSRRLLRTIRHKNWLFYIDRAFEDVIRGCAADRDNDPGTWITSQMIDAYCGSATLTALKSGNKTKTNKSSSEASMGWRSTASLPENQCFTL